MRADHSNGCKRNRESPIIKTLKTKALIVLVFSIALFGLSRHTAGKKQSQKPSSKSSYGIASVSEPPCGGAVEKAHSNGGGFVAKTAQVDPTAYVGLQAQVCDQSQVSDEARVYGKAEVYGKAQVQGFSRIFGKAWVHRTLCLLFQTRFRLS